MLQKLLRFSWLVGMLMLTGTALSAPKADLWPYWASHNEQSTTALDHSIWQQLLDTYVFENSDDINRVAYKQFSSADTKLLETYIRMMASVAPSGLNRAEQLAYWISLDNSLPVQVVIAHPKAKTNMKINS